MPLINAKPGHTVRIRAITAGRSLQARLAALGLVPGVELQVVSNNARGPFIVAFKYSRLALGRGMALKIEVE